MARLSPLEASVLSSVADNPGEYSLDEFHRLVPEPCPAATDIARVLLGNEPAPPPGQPPTYDNDVRTTAQAFQNRSRLIKDVHVPYLTSR